MHTHMILCVCKYVCMYVCMPVGYVFQHGVLCPKFMIPVSVNNTFLAGEPLPCDPAASTASQPLIWCLSS